MKRSIFLTFVFAFVALAVNASELKFMASQDLSYDDNIYLTNGNRIGSGISSTKVGALYDLIVPNSSLKGTFSAVGGYNAYTKHNGDNGYWDALVNAEVSNNIFKVGNRFLLTSDPANAELTERKQRINNNVYASIRTSSYKKLSLGLKVSDEINKYTVGGSIQDLDRNRVNVGAGVYYNVSEKTSLLAEYTYTALAYNSNENNNSRGGIVALGVEGQVAPKITGEAKATYNYRDYTHELTGYDNYADLFGYNVALAWEPTTQNLIRLSGERTFEETVYTNNRYFVTTGVKLYASQKIMKKFTAGVTLGYENLSYDKAVAGIERSDDVYTVRPEVDYQFKEWLSAGVWYQYRKRASNAGADNFYLNNRVGVFVKAIF